MDEVVGSGRVDRGLVLCDLDGCLIAGNRALPGAARLVATCGDRLWIVSNNSTDKAETLAVRLSCLGLHIPTNRIILAGEETLRALASTRSGMRIALFAAYPLLALADDLGLLRTDVDPEVTVLARDPGLTLLRQSRLAALVHRGVPLHLTNPDPSHPGDHGAPVPETGALLAALAAVVPAVSPACLGKPSPDLLRIALARAGAAPSDADADGRPHHAQRQHRPFLDVLGRVDEGALLHRWERQLQERLQEALVDVGAVLSRR